MKQYFSLFLIILLTLSSFSGVGGSNPTDTIQSPEINAEDNVESLSTPTLIRNTTLYLTPEIPGEIKVVVNFHIPDSIVSLKTQLPNKSNVLISEGFTNPGNTTYRWENATSNPRLVFTVPANRSGIGDHPTGEAGYLFVDTGPWALVEVPRMPVHWFRTGPEINAEDNVKIAGEGATGGEMAYLGPMQVYTRQAYDQTFRLVVPAVAELRESPDMILDALTDAANILRVGERDDKVFFIAAPVNRVDFAVRGLSGGSDAWVAANASLNSASNPWFHEYVHTRQGFRTTAAIQWVIEGSADYYAGYLSLKLGLITFEEFRNDLDQGSKYRDVILANPETWRPGAIYLKGSLVYGNIDRKIRKATNSRKTAGDVLSLMNLASSPVTANMFYSFIESVGGRKVADYAYFYTTTDNVPQVWSQQEHSNVFAIEPPKLVIEFGRQTFSISGPYRNKTQSTLPTILAGETIEISLRVTNTGSIGGTFIIPFEVDNEIVDQVNVYLEAGETKTITVSETFHQPGLYQIHIKSISKELRVLSPVSPTVATFTVSKSTVTPGTSVTVMLEFANPTNIPARKTYTLTLDGNVIFRQTITLESGQTTSYSVTVSLNETGKHVFAIGEKSITVTVRNTTSPQPTETTTTGQPGFTILLSVISGCMLGILYLIHGRTR
ncbi:MAG: hypothetical protein ABEI06_02095 [Halobacteriaceae archaeon]